MTASKIIIGQNGGNRVLTFEEVRLSAPPPEFVPRLMKTRTTRTGLVREALPETEDAILWERHTKGLTNNSCVLDTRSVTLLDLKVELVRRQLVDCRLCGHQCGVNRFRQTGKCGVLEKLTVAEAFGQGALLTPAGEHPTTRLFSILNALNELPADCAGRPFVWNDVGYAMPLVYEFLDGLVDVYLVDFLGGDPCVERQFTIQRYWNSVTKGIVRMICQKARIIVRVVARSGHVECCQKPTLEWLAQYRHLLWIDLPEGGADPRHTSQAEMAQLGEFVKAMGLRDVDAHPESFWEVG